MGAVTSVYEGDIAKRNADLSALATLIGGGASLYSRYGAGGPASTDGGAV